MKCAKNAGIGSEFDNFDFKTNETQNMLPLMKLETNKCVQYWVDKVM